MRLAVRLIAALAAATPMTAVGQTLNQAPEQVDVSVKIVEFQTTKTIETGFSAYFAREVVQRPYGRVTSGSGNIVSADLTFPTAGTPTVTAFLDRIALSDGDIEMVLQALVEENRAFILSRPKALVMMGQTTKLGTTQKIPYEATKVVGTTAIQVTEFRDTGVSLEILLNGVIDDDGNWDTKQDTYIDITIDASVSEEGQQFVIALDDNATSTNFNQSQNAIRAPEFITRRLKTQTWVRDGQVLVLGGLFRRSKQKSLRTAPWLPQAEDAAIGLAENLVPGNFLASPVSATIGNRSSNEGYRELVFIIKADVWRPSLSAYDFFDGDDENDDEKPKRPSPTDIITEILEIPKGIAEGITGTEPAPTDDIQRNLGNPRE